MDKLKLTFARTLLITASLSLAACSSNNPYTEQQQVNKSSSGTMAGAATGAIVGGAAGAGLAGTGAGYMLDKQESQMRQDLRSTGVSVMEIEGSNDIVLIMPSHIHFTSASTEISPAFKEVLSDVAKVMKKYPTTVAEIPGFADSRGSAKYNMQLAASRAQAVADYIISQDINKDRIVTVAYGEAKPLASNATSKGRALNRRVQIILHTGPTTGIDKIKPVEGNKK